MLRQQKPLSSGPGGVGRADGRSSLRLWLKADVDVISRADYVMQWLDQSGYRNNALQVVAAAQPTFMPQNPTFNRMPTVRFNGYGAFLQINHHDSLSLTDHLTIFVVYQSNDLNRNHGLLSKTSSCGDDGNYGLAINGAKRQVLFEHYTHTWWDFSSEAALTNQPTILNFTYDSRFGGGAFGLSGQFAGQFRSRLSLKANQQPLDIGVHRRCKQQGLWFSGDLAELIIYRGNVNTAQRIIIENYLSAKYAIPLPTTNRGKDIFRGNLPEYGSYILDVAGIGYEADGKHQESHSAGITVEDVSFLQNRGDYLIFGHKSPTNHLLTADIPEGVSTRWERVWFFEVTDRNANSGLIKLHFQHTSAEMNNPDITHVLLERADESSPFLPIAEADTPSEGECVTFTLSTHNLISGRQYTVGQVMPATILNLLVDTVHKMGDYIKRKSQPMLAINQQPTQRRQQMQKPQTIKLVAINKPYLEKTGSLTHADFEEAFSRTLQTVEGRLSRDIWLKIEAIQQAIQQTLPYIPDINSSDPTVYAVRQITLEYLPETLENYLALPTQFALNEPLKDAKTARQLLLEQLQVLEQKLQTIAADFHRQDADKLLAHGRFLQERFGQSESLLD